MKRSRLAIVIGAGLALAGGSAYLIATGHEEDDAGDSLERYSREQARKLSRRKAAEAKAVVAASARAEDRGQIVVEQPTGSYAELDELRVRIEGALVRIDACWSGRDVPGAGGGTITLTFAIDDHGRTVGTVAKSTMLDDTTACVAKVVESITFLRSDSAARASVRLTFTPP